MTAVNRHRAGGWVVYFNGIEIPATRVSVSNQMGEIPEAQISIPPDSTMRRVGAEDRVRATVFYHDSVQDEMCLLFDGEIVNYNYSTSSNGRSLQFTAVDLMAVLTQVSSLFVTSLDAIVSSQVGSGDNVMAATVNPFSVVTSLFSQGLSSGEHIERPFDLIWNIFSLLLGEGSVDAARSVIAEQWFSQWLKRTKFLDRIIPTLDSSEESRAGGFPILETVQETSALQSLQREGAEVAPSSNFYMLIQTLFQRLYYDLTAVLAPPCVTVEGETKYVIGPAEDSFPREGHVYEDTSEEGEVPDDHWAIGQHISHPKNFYGIPPRCNVIWPSTTEKHSYSENFATQPTRSYLGVPFLVQDGNRNAPAMSEMTDANTTVAYPEKAQKALDGSRAGEQEKNNFLVYPEEFFKGPVYHRLNAPKWYSMLGDSPDDFMDNRTHRLYAAMEHYRERMSRRNGSVNMVFNPYVLVGHPCTIMDSVETNHHVFGYVVSVRHTLTQSSMNTQVSYTNGQTFEEFFENYITEVNEHTEEAVVGGEDSDEAIAFTPIHPIRTTRERFQSMSGAQEFYSRNFWGSTDSRVVFDWHNTLGVRTVDFNTKQMYDLEPLTFGLEDSNAIARESEGYIPEYDVFPRYQQFMKDPDAALTYNHRPVCTLEQFIDFQGEYGTREGRRLPSHDRENKSSPYYVKILDFVQGPGEEQGETSEGDRCGVLEADTRRNWEVRFLTFRDKVYNADHPHRS